ncbi:MAG TPA: TatD family hydrolase [Chloroflexota bacterium]|nr:TatD family hydrolase [Chloroflexota bacterium]
MFADSHVHLHAYVDPPSLLERAAVAGVDLVVGISVDLASAGRTLEITRQARARRDAGVSGPVVIAAVGLHPSDLTGPLEPATFSALEDLARDPLVGFIGEIGLDAVEAKVPLVTQAAAFRAQLDLAGGLGKPVNLHVRGAIEETLEILAAVGPPTAGAVFHYFTGDRALAERLLAAGLSISVGKPVTRPGNAALRAAVETIPLDRLLLETDSYPLPGRTTEPADLPRVARAVADLKRLPVEAVAEATTGNLLRICASG